MSPRPELLYTMTLTGSLWCAAVRNSHISMLKPPSPQRAMTWRSRFTAWMPLAWPRAVPTAAEGVARRLGFPGVEAVGRAGGGPEGGFVKGADDPLRAALANPVGG